MPSDNKYIQQWWFNVLVAFYCVIFHKTGEYVKNKPNSSHLLKKSIAVMSYISYLKDAIDYFKIQDIMNDSSYPDSKIQSNNQKII